MQPVHIIEMLNRNVAGRVDVGRIDLMQNFSFFECPEEYTEEIIEGMSGVNYKGREVNVEVAETRSEGAEQTEERPVKERKVRKEDKPRREEKPFREERPRREEKTVRKKKSYMEEKPSKKEKARSNKIERHTAQRAPQVQIAQDDDFWENFEKEDWRQFFRSEEGRSRRGAGRSESKPSKRKEKKPARKEKPSASKEKVNGRKASRTVTKPKKSRR